MTSQSATERSPAYGPLWVLLLPLMIAEVVASLELTMIYAAMRSLISHFGSASAAGWLVTSFMLSSAAGAALFGRVGDLLGRKRVLVFVLSLAAAGSLLSAVMHDLPWVIAGRALQGSAGAIIPLCYGIVRERCDPARLSFAIGLLAAATSISSALGLVIGGVVIDWFDWTMIFKVTATLGALAAVSALLLISPDRQWNPHVMREDLLGGLLFVPAAICLLLAIDNAGHHGVGEPMTAIYALLAVLSLGAWIWRELTAHKPLIEVRLLATRAIGAANGLYIALALGAFQGGQIMALFGQQDPDTGAGLGLSATAAGLLLLPANLITAMCYPLVARLCDARGPRFTATAGFVTIIIGFGALALWHHDVATVMVLLVIQSVGLGFVYVTIPMVIVKASPPDRVSESTGMMSVIRATAMAVGAQTVATLLSPQHGTPGGAPVYPGEGDYITVFLFICSAALLGVVLTRLLPARLTIHPGRPALA